MNYKHEGKPRLTLLYPHFLDEMAHLQEYGDVKHEGLNHWTNGVPITELLDAIKRHTAAIEMGEINDGETGRSHTAAIGLCAMYIFYYTRNSGQYSEFFTLVYARSDAISNFLADGSIPEPNSPRCPGEVPGGGGGDLQESMRRGSGRLNDTSTRPSFPPKY